MSEILLQAFIYLCAAVIAVPLAKRLGLGSVLGYLIAGVLIGPAIGLVGSETQDIQHFAEFGVVMMLFLVGLELKPKALWEMRTRLLGLGGMQVGLTSAAIAAIALAFGLDWRVSLVVGMVLALSSTAIVLQTLNEKQLTRSDGGKASFSVLLFQDIAAIPMLAVIPLLALPELATYGAVPDVAEHAPMSLVDGLAGWQVALVNVGAIAAVIIGGRFLSRPLFGLTFGLMALKALVLLVLSRVVNVHGGDAWLFAMALAQAGEFGFVLLAFAVQNSAIGGGLAAILLLVVALSMLLTPVLFIVLDKMILPRLNAGKARAVDTIDEAGPVIIAGHGRFGQIIDRVLLANGHKTVVLEQKADLIDGMRRFGVRSYYGDATRPDLLNSAGLQDARLLVVAIDDPDKAIELIEHARRERPDLHIIARAVDRTHVYRLYSSGANDIVRETFDSSVRASRYALQALGMHPFDAERSATVFVNHDRDAIRRMAKL